MRSRETLSPTQNWLEYDELSSTRELPEPRRFSNFLEKIPYEGQVLDLGCGTARWSIAMQKERSDLIIDLLDPRMAELNQHMKSQGLDAEFMARTQPMNEVENALGNGICIERKIQDFRTTRPVYDGIWARASLVYVPQKEISETINNIHSMLRPNGVLALTHIYPSHEARALGMRGIAKPAMIKLLNDAGFEVSETTERDCSFSQGKQKLKTYTIHAKKMPVDD